MWFCPPAGARGGNTLKKRVETVPFEKGMSTAVFPSRNNPQRIGFSQAKESGLHARNQMGMGSTAGASQVLEGFNQGAKHLVQPCPIEPGHHGVHWGFDAHGYASGYTLKVTPGEQPAEMTEPICYTGNDGIIRVCDGAINI
jgi:hypothetical protein